MHRFDLRRTGVLVALILVLALAAAPGPSAQAPAAQSAGGDTTTTWYFYRVKWGFQDEFVTLFAKNHWPLLKAQVGGRFVSVKTYVPRYHGDGRADWTFAVEIVAKDDFTGGPSEEDLIRKLYPDQATYKKEEQRRFEILDAHWDVPLNGVDLDVKK